MVNIMVMATIVLIYTVTIMLIYAVVVYAPVTEVEVDGDYPSVVGRCVHEVAGFHKVRPPWGRPVRGGACCPRWYGGRSSALARGFCIWLRLVVVFFAVVGVGAMSGFQGSLSPPCGAGAIRDFKRFLAPFSSPDGTGQIPTFDK